MKERERKSLMTSLELSSIAGSAVITFGLTFFVLFYGGIGFIPSITFALIFSLLTTLARMHSNRRF